MENGKRYMVKINWFGQTDTYKGVYFAKENQLICKGNFLNLTGHDILSVKEL